jgi:hypothetical protein
MPTVALNITPGLIPATETNLFGAIPAGHEYDLPVIRFVNNDPLVSHQLTIWNKVGAGAGTNADVESKLSIQPQSTYEHGPLALPAGRVISVMADQAGFISCRPSGWDVT